MNSIDGKVAVITGSSMGIGKALAIEMAQRGARVVLNGRDKTRLDETHQMLLDNGYDVTAISGDVSNFNDCEKLIEHTLKSYGKIDYLINNAGLSAEGEIEKMQPDLFKKIIDVNYLGSIFPTKVALPYIKASKGSILFISSLAAIHGLPEYSAYCSSKMALTAVAESLKTELSGTGVHVGIAYLGFIQNDPNKKVYKANGELEVIPIREGVKVQPVKNTAHRLIKMIENRTYKLTFSTIGKLLLFLNRFTPMLLEQFFYYSYKKKKDGKG
ncbi:MAG: SDR family oxidoreductase [Phaeodactylibacter sp.]|nr:SDR family oxidoreductase [Phaeodactylibacter sp.]MCB9301836.1 SDR family oxidoreductase [Lewinellaceae bacterium]